MPKRGDLSAAAEAGPLVPPLILIRAFEAVGRTGSMRRAAADIHVSHTVVSRHVRNLEAWLGVKLLDAGPHGSTLTPEGTRLFAGVNRGLQLIARAVQDLRPEVTQRTLRVWCMPGLATRWLAPRLSAIREALPGVSIILRAIDRLPDFRHHEADVMIAYGAAKAFGPHALPLVRPRMFPVTTPRWLAGHPVVSVAGLPSPHLIHEESDQQWRDWFSAVGVKPRGPLEGPRLWDANLGLDAALAGQGIALASRLTAGDEIEAGRLVEVLRSNVRLGGYYLLTSPDRKDDPAVRKFQLWLRNAMRLDEKA